MKTLSFFIFALVPAWNAGAAEEHFPVGHPDQDLPRPEFVPAPYHEDSNQDPQRAFCESHLLLHPGQRRNPEMIENPLWRQGIWLMAHFLAEGIEEMPN